MVCPLLYGIATLLIFMYGYHRRRRNYDQDDQEEAAGPV